ncbi:sensor histidine kinase [Aquimarina sp. M1]
MDISNTTQESPKFFQFDKVLFTVMFIALPGIILDGIVEYNEGGLSPYFYRALITFVIVTGGLLVQRTGLMRKSRLLTLSVYTIVLGMMSSVFFGIHDPDFSFESFFLKVEVIISLLFFAVGMLVHFRHIIFLLTINFLFIFLCTFYYPYFPLEKLTFYFVIVSGGGLMAYFCQRVLVQLSRKVKEANRLISIKNEELKEMNQSKDDLFRIIGHDLRTPFYQLRCLIDMVDDVDDEKEREHIKTMIKEAADRGNHLLEDLLEWGNIYKKQSRLLLEKKEISVIVDKVFAFSDLKTKKKEISLINRLPRDLKVTINPIMMETVMRNLITNAIKFSHRGSDIIVKSEKMDSYIRIAIEDKGVGMCDHSIYSLFTEEKNNSTTGTENERGTGFGLSIAKKLVEKQHGILEIQSEYNKGTTINLYFPYTLSA